MNNISILEKESYDTLIKLSDHFRKIAKRSIRSQFDYDKPEYLDNMDKSEKINKIISDRFFFDINNDSESQYIY